LGLASFDKVMADSENEWFLSKKMSLYNHFQELMVLFT